MDTPWAYCNGEWKPSDRLGISVEDIGFQLGATVTERLRTFGQRVFRLDEHLSRMARSLEIVGLNADVIAGQIAGAVPEFIRRNQLQIAAGDDWSIVAFATPGVGEGGPPTVCVHGSPLMFGRWARQYELGVSVVVSDVRQVPENCWPTDLKCRSRMHYFLADRRAAAAQRGARALILDQDGYVAEATTANVLIYRNGEGLVSPPAAHILVGVSLGVVGELAARLKMPFVMRRLTVNEFQAADEALLTSTSICLLPIVQCDGLSIGDGQPGPVFHRLLAAWSDLVGLDVAEQARKLANR